MTNIQNGDDIHQLHNRYTAYQLKILKNPKEKILEKVESITSGTLTLLGVLVIKHKAEYMVKDEFGDPITAVVWYFLK